MNQQTTPVSTNVVNITLFLGDSSEKFPKALLLFGAGATRKTCLNTA
jgi:hypothetical protein